MVRMDTCGGAGGGEAVCGYVLVAGAAEREREEKEIAKIGRKGWFLADFGPDFSPFSGHQLRLYL